MGRSQINRLGRGRPGRGQGRLFCGTLLALAAFHALPASAQPTDVPGMIGFVEAAPVNMEAREWKEKRREVAKKLIATKDKRATSTLAKIAQTETFDIIGEIAIEGLGQLGDAAAIPTLQAIVSDTSRDKKQRDLATAALARLGAKPAAKPATAAGTATNTSATAGPATSPVSGQPTGAPTATAPSAATKPIAGAPSERPLIDSSPTPPIEVGTGPVDGTPGDGSAPQPATGLLSPTPAGPGALTPVADDTLAVSDRLQVAFGSASIGYDSVRKRSSYNGDLAATWNYRKDTTSRMVGLGASARGVFGRLNPDGNAVSTSFAGAVGANGEYRAYAGSGLYGVARGALWVNLTHLSAKRDNGEDFKDVKSAADLGVALGVGYGRMVDLGAKMRVDKIAGMLGAANLLGKPIDAGTALRLQQVWWQQRGARSLHQMLLGTVATLREAGILLTEPDASTTYQLLAILRDAQFGSRLAGHEVDLTMSEALLWREEDPEGQSVTANRAEQLMLRAAIGRQTSATTDLSATGYGRVLVLAGENQPAPWAVGATARARLFRYNEFAEPTGTWDVTATAALSSDDTTDGNLGLAASVELGYALWLNWSSNLRIAANATFDSGDVMLGAVVQGNYGLANGTLAR